MRLVAPVTKITKSDDANWPGWISYGVGSDFADTRSPRAYSHAISGSLGYNFDSNWRADLIIGASTQTVNGQIIKGEEQREAETLSPSTAASLTYSNYFNKQLSYSIGLNGEPLWDEPSRREGYNGIYGVGTGISIRLFRRHYTMSHSLGYSQMSPTYEYNSVGRINQDSFANYSFGNSLKVGAWFNISYSFGGKLTRYLDGSSTYSYSNIVGINRSWNQFSTYASYTNGGFTQDGEVSLWYLDQYRRLFRMGVSYAF